MGDTIYFQIGEVKYGKPILDRIIQPSTSLNDAVKCALDLLRSDHALQRVGWAADRHLRLPARLHGSRLHHQARKGQTPIFDSIRDAWGSALHKAFQGHRAGARLEDLAFGVSGYPLKLQERATREECHACKKPRRGSACRRWPLPRLTLPASAELSGYTIAPAGPADPRNSYVPQAGAVFVVDDAKGANHHVLSRQQGQQGRGRLHAGDQAAAIGTRPRQAGGFGCRW